METIKLNVSGTSYEIEKDTLIRASYFTPMFSGNFAIPVQPIFIPCGVEAFNEIIRFLRFEQPFDPKYIPEFTYFGIRYTEEDFKTLSEDEIKDQNLDKCYKYLMITEQIYKVKNLRHKSPNYLGHDTPSEKAQKEKIVKNYI